MANKVCPFCKENVKADAIICKHCKSELPPLPPKKWYQTWKGLLLILFMLSFISRAFDNNQSTKTQSSPEEIAAKQQVSDSIDARTYAKLYVEKSLKAPSTAKWQNVMDFAVAPLKDREGKTIKDIWEVSGYVDAQNSFGAMIRTQWYVKLKKIGNSWTLLEIKSQKKWHDRCAYYQSTRKAHARLIRGALRYVNEGKYMHDLRTIEIPKITDDVKFEYLCRDLWKNNRVNDPVSFNGCPGQAQDGVDVYGRNTQSKEWFGIQCKVRKEGNKLSKVEIYKEVNKAKAFNPSLKQYYLCTTLKRDVHLQSTEREIIEELQNSDNFSFKLLFWDDIEEMLKMESNINVYINYYQKFFIDNTTLGHSIGKLINLDLGLDSSVDTHYELIVGKIPNYKDKKHANVDYYRGVYYIINLHEKKMETFSPRCFESDIETAFRSKFDSYRIANWINSIQSLDDFIYDDTYDVEFFMSEEKRKIWLKKYTDENDT